MSDTDDMDLEELEAMLSGGTMVSSVLSRVSSSSSGRTLQ